MPRLSDEQLDMIESELLQPGAHITGRRTHIPSLIAELRALRKVADAAKLVFDAQAAKIAELETSFLELEKRTSCVSAQQTADIITRSLQRRPCC